ncbi:MAG: PorT family protein [Candidatus Symbiothrix sp.]|jgi:hypothetical protein|nr:PorT family protein [Candidatus Symbiothrix sp.]
MRKIVFTFFFCLITGSAAFAQYFQYGIVIGTDISTFDVNYPIDHDKGWTDYRYKVGFRVALAVDYVIIPNKLHISSEFAFTQRGAAQEQTDSIHSKYKYNINYFQLPVNLLYKVEIGENTKLLAFVGPYFSYALSGKMKSENKDLRTGQTWNNTMKYQFGTHLKSIDLGFNVGFGFEYYDYFLKLQYDHSLINILPGNGFYQKNQNIGVSLGFMF